MENYSDERSDAIFIIESLRSGIPTRLSTRNLPDLRKNLTDKIRYDLENFDIDEVPMGKLIWGQYGQGKTHFLTTAEHIALEAGFAVSRVSLSREVSCHNLFKFYSKVAPRVRTTATTSSGIQSDLNKKSSSDLPKSSILDKDRYMHPLPQLIFEDYYYTIGEEQDKIYSDLMGIRIPISEFRRIHRANHPEFVLPKYESFKETKHAVAYFGLMADVIKFCGYKGWVLLIDEIELIGRLGKVSRLKAYLNLNWLLNWSNEMIYPIYTIAAAATRLQDDIWFGRKNNDRDIMPEIAYEKFGNKEKKEMKTFFVNALEKLNITVSPATESELIKLLDAIVRLHEKAYEWDSSFDTYGLISKLGHQTARTYIRGALESLDLQYLYNEKVQLDVSEIKEDALEEDENFFNEE